MLRARNDGADSGHPWIVGRLEKRTIGAFVDHRQVDANVGVGCHGSQLVDHEGSLVQPDSDLSVEGWATVFESDGNPSQQKDRCGNQQTDCCSEQVDGSFGCELPHRTLSWFDVKERFATHWKAADPARSQPPEARPDLHVQAVCRAELDHIVNLRCGERVGHQQNAGGVRLPGDIRKMVESTAVG